MKHALILALTALTACSSPSVVKDRPVRVAVPVAQSCALQRPVPVASLATLYPDDVWNAMDVKMKSAAVGKWALDLLTYSEQLHAATAACP